jgi:hypothetical protein
MKALLRVIRNGAPYVPTGESLKYFECCTQQQPDDGLYTAYQEDEGGECSIFFVKEEGSPWAI